jgi:hypothetical protein
MAISRGYPSQNKPRPEVRLGVARQEGADEHRLTTRRSMRERIMLGGCCNVKRQIEHSVSRLRRASS